MTINWSRLKRHFVAIVNSQMEYWNREFQAEVIRKDDAFQKNVTLLVSRGVVPVIQLDNDQDELEFLKSLPAKSVIGWCYSDEGLDTNFASSLSKLDSLLIILRPYHLNSFKVRNLVLSCKYVISNLENVKTLKNGLKLTLWYFRGLAMCYREQKIRKIYKDAKLKYLNFPLGYTDVFCSSIVTSPNIQTDNLSGSLLDLTILHKNDVRNHLVFIGQIGQIVRSVAISAARSTRSSTIITRFEYGAGSLLEKGVQEKGIEYLNTVLDSKFVLCPPGNISGNSFRIHETVLLGRLPIVLSHIASDPNFFTPFENKKLQYKGQSWKKRILETTQISDKEYKLKVAENLSTLRLQINQTKYTIDEYLK